MTLKQQWAHFYNLIIDFSGLSDKNKTSIWMSLMIKLNQFEFKWGRSEKHLLKQQRWGNWVPFLFRPTAEQLRAAWTKVANTELLSSRCLTPSQVKVSHGDRKKNPFLQELMQLRKHIIVYCSVPGASGAPHKPESLLQIQKILNSFGSETKCGQ